MDFSRLKVYVNLTLCPYYCYLWGRCKDLQRRKMIQHIFCLESAVAIKWTNQSLPLKIYHDSDIPDSQILLLSDRRIFSICTGKRSRTPTTTWQVLLFYCYLSSWLQAFTYCPSDPPLYTTVHTFSLKKFFLV